MRWILDLQRTIGNREVQRLLEADTGIRCADVPLQRNATGEVLDRQSGPQQEGLKIELQIGRLTLNVPLETNGQVAAVARLAIASLQDELGDVAAAAVKKQVTDWIATTKGTLPYFERHSGDKVDPFIGRLVTQHHRELLRVREAVHQDKLSQIKEALWREHDATVRAAQQAEALRPALDAALRAAYRRGSNRTLEEAVSAVKGALSIGRSIRSLAAGITTDILGLPIASGTKVYVDHWMARIGHPKITIINVGKHTESLGKLGRGLSALNVALTIADRSKKTTEVEQGMKDLSDAVTIGTDVISASSSLAVPPHFSLYATLYLKPALKVISKQIGVLVENLSDVNIVAVELTGELMYPNAEPGGAEMFHVMVEVMHARDESGSPELPDRVQKYLFDHREKLGTGTESEVPTEWNWFRKRLDGPAGRLWLFANRHRVWAMFYGSMKVPSGKPRSVHGTSGRE